MENLKSEQNEDLFLQVWKIQEIAECLKWIADTQDFLGGKEDVNLFNEDNACGGWHIAKITQTLAEVIIEKSEKLIEELK